MADALLLSADDGTEDAATRESTIEERAPDALSEEASDRTPMTGELLAESQIHESSSWHPPCSSLTLLLQSALSGLGCCRAQEQVSLAIPVTGYSLVQQLWCHLVSSTSVHSEATMRGSLLQLLNIPSHDELQMQRRCGCCTC